MAAFWLAWYTGKRIIRSRTIPALLFLLPVLGTVALTGVPSAFRTGWLIGVWVMGALLAAGVISHFGSVDERTGLAEVVTVSVEGPSVQFWAQATLFAAMLAGQVIVSLLITIFV